MKKNLVVIALQLGFVVAYAQNNKKKPSGDAPAMAMLNTEQKTEVKQVNRQFVSDMKSLLQQPVTNPIERRQKIEKLRASRDSTLKAKLGEQTFSEYQQKAIKRKQS